MFSVENVRTLIENLLNTKLAATLGAEEAQRSPFRIFADIGEAQKAHRELNTVYSHRYGVMSVLTSNVTPIHGLSVYTATVSVDILVNVDQASTEMDDFGDYAPVKETRRMLDEIAAESSAVATSTVIDGETFSVVPVFTIATAGTFAVDASELGKVVPLTFSADFSVVESGINSTAIQIKVDGVEIPVSQIAGDMVFSSEGQTRVGASRSTFNVQEARFGLSFVTPLINSNFCQDMIALMHQGNISGTVPTYQVTVVYPFSGYSSQMQVSSVRLTGQIPNNAGLNIEMVEADTLPT